MGGRARVEYVPKGVVGNLGTWNFPVYTAILPLAHDALTLPRLGRPYELRMTDIYQPGTALVAFVIVALLVRSRAKTASAVSLLAACVWARIFAR